MPIFKKAKKEHQQSTEPTDYPESIKRMEQELIAAAAKLMGYCEKLKKRGDKLGLSDEWYRKRMEELNKYQCSLMEKEANLEKKIANLKLFAEEVMKTELELMKMEEEIRKKEEEIKRNSFHFYLYGL